VIHLRRSDITAVFSVSTSINQVPHAVSIAVNSGFLNCVHVPAQVGTWCQNSEALVPLRLIMAGVTGLRAHPCVRTQPEVNVLADELASCADREVYSGLSLVDLRDVLAEAAVTVPSQDVTRLIQMLLTGVPPLLRLQLILMFSDIITLSFYSCSKLFSRCLRPNFASLIRKTNKLRGL
jgi:hypothetical protein